MAFPRVFATLRRAYTISSRGLVNVLKAASYLIGHEEPLSRRKVSSFPLAQDGELANYFEVTASELTASR